MKNLPLYITLLLLITCSKEDSFDSNVFISQNVDLGKKAVGKIVSSPITSSSPVTQYKLTVGTNQGGWVSFGETSLRRRTGFYIFRPAGTEVTVSAEPADGYVFSGWSNGWTANPITFKLNSNIGFSAEFKTTND